MAIKIEKAAIGPQHIKVVQEGCITKILLNDVEIPEVVDVMYSAGIDECSRFTLVINAHQEFEVVSDNVQIIVNLHVEPGLTIVATDNPDGTRTFRVEKETALPYFDKGERRAVDRYGTRVQAQNRPYPHPDRLYPQPDTVKRDIR